MSDADGIYDTKSTIEDFLGCVAKEKEDVGDDSCVFLQVLQSYVSFLFFCTLLSLSFMHLEAVDRKRDILGHAFSAVWTLCLVFEHGPTRVAVEFARLMIPGICLAFFIGFCFAFVALDSLPFIQRFIDAMRMSFGELEITKLFRIFVAPDACREVILNAVMTFMPCFVSSWSPVAPEFIYPMGMNAATVYFRLLLSIYTFVGRELSAVWHFHLSPRLWECRLECPFLTSPAIKRLNFWLRTLRFYLQQLLCMSWRFTPSNISRFPPSSISHPKVFWMSWEWWPT